MNRHGPRRAGRRRRDGDALSIAIYRGQWERISLYLILATSEALRTAPPGTIDDLLRVLANEDARDDG